MHPLAEKILAKEVRALARAISYIENDHPERLTILKDLHLYRHKAYKLGITGAPGAGKSSLVNRLITYLRQQQLSVGIIAVDPTSPFTGGAILGDRVRMSHHYTDPGVYIRSMGTRGSLGGLARATKEAIHLLDAYGQDVIIVETVGVGQSELDIMDVVDTTAVILTPGGGDTVQAFKAGIMEIADMYVINKADVDGADKLKAEMEHMLDIAKHDSPWRPPIVKTISTQNQGIVELWKVSQQHKEYLQQFEEGKRRKEQHLVDEVIDVIHSQFDRLVERKMKEPLFQEKIQDMQENKSDPYSTAEELYTLWMNRNI